MNYCGFFFNEDIKTVRYEKAKEQKQTNSSPVILNLSGAAVSSRSWNQIWFLAPVPNKEKSRFQNNTLWGSRNEIGWEVSESLETLFTLKFWD